MAAGPSGGRGDKGRVNRAVRHNYKRMNELSKDAVSWLTVGEDAAGQRVDNYLGKVLKAVRRVKGVTSVDRREVSTA